MSGSGQQIVVSVHGSLESDDVGVLLDVIEAACDSVRHVDQVELDLRATSTNSPETLRVVAQLIELGIRIASDDC